MAPISSIPDYGLDTSDIKYLRIDSMMQGRGPNRLKYLDLEGRWVLSGKSIPYISAAFNHLERLNNAQVSFRDIVEEPLNAIGMVGWTPSSEPAKVEKKPLPRVIRPSVFVDDEVPPSPREAMPHRSAGYGPAHQKRKLSVPDRSRSVSPARGESTDFDKYAKYERNRKDSMTRYGTKWGDAGYQSSSPSPTDRPYKDELKVSTKENNKYIPYRSGGYGSAHEKRQYDISPRSIGSAAGDYSSGSEQSSPVGKYETAEEVILTRYHSSKQSPQPRQLRRDWIQH